MIPLRYFQAYPASPQDQIRQLIAENRLGEYLERRYPGHHDVQSDRALYVYTMNLKREHLCNTPDLDKVLYDNKFDVVQHALDLHTAISRMQGDKFRTKKGARIASLFKDTTPEFLQMIIIHEFTHLKESGYNKAFYQPCQYILPDHHQLEFDLRVYLTWKNL